MSIVSMLIMVFVVNSLYFFWEVNALFVCKLPKIKVLVRKTGSKFDTTRMVTEGKTWEFFEFGKDSNLIAKGVLENRNMRMGLSARYISFGENCEEMPALFSPGGYELIFPAKWKILCCSIPMYGPYIAFENTDLIDYYFKISS